MQACVHAGSVRLEQRLPFGTGLGQGLLGDVSKAVDAHLRVDRDRARSDERGQLAGRLSALKVHLEEAILGVKEASAPVRRRVVAPAIDGSPERHRGSP